MTHSQRLISQFAGCTSGANLPPTAWREGNFRGSMQQHAPAGVASPVGQRLNTLGITARADVDAFWKLVKVRDEIDRGQTIVSSTGLVKRFTVLLEGVACFSTLH